MPVQAVDADATIVADNDIIAQLSTLTLMEQKKPREIFNPADFLKIQSMRSAALAGKTRTTKKNRNSESLFADLLLSQPPIPADNETVSSTPDDVTVVFEKKTIPVEDKEEKKEEDNEDEFLLVRGPVMRKKNKNAMGPYEKKDSPRKEIIEFASYSATGDGYECGASAWADLHTPPADEGRASVITKVGTPSAPMTGLLLTPQRTPEDPSSSKNEDGAESSKNGQEIPDNLVDFILQYTRQVATPLATQQQQSTQQEQQASSASSPVPSTSPVSPESLVATTAAAAVVQTTSSAKTAPALVIQPVEAGAAAEASPETGPIPAVAAVIAASVQAAMRHSTFPRPVLPFNMLRALPAKIRLRDNIGMDRIDVAMSCLWQCIEEGFEEDGESRAGLVWWRDARDGNTLLHHALMGSISELAQPYVIVEQQLLLPNLIALFGLPWDISNNFGETPLWNAVQTNKTMFVEYLLALGADPNVSTTRENHDSALHHAATRGLTSIVKSLTADSRCNLDVTNARGETPLYSAVMYNNAIVRVSGLRMDNIAVAELLLQAGADPTKTDRSSTNIFHVAANYCDTAMLEMFARLIPEDVAQQLSTARNVDGMQPVDYLKQHEGSIDDARYQRCFYALLIASANLPENLERAAADASDSP